ncbi:MAG: lytic transglycosylase domain-containing protein [Elusimicrobiota bacterium]|nr:lytic transglycosylase domain-containing protein [Elusimicrobiota bacterium]
MMSLWLVLAATHAAAQEPPVMPQLAFANPGGLSRLFDASIARPDLAVDMPGVRADAPAPASPRRAAPAPVARFRASTLHQQLVVPIPRETPAYRRTFKRMLAQTDTTDRYDDLILKYARRHRIDARLIKAVMAAESEFRPDALSPAGARGLMQVMPATAEGLKVPADKLYDPEHGIKAGTGYLAELLRAAWKKFKLKGVRYTDAPEWVIQRVVAAYHAGPRFLTSTRWFGATRAYVRKVVLFYRSKVTDLRRPVRVPALAPSFREFVAPSGTLH